MSTSGNRRAMAIAEKKKQTIWIDNYGAGNNASPLEVHTYWNEVMKSEQKSKKYHKDQS